MAKNKIDFLTRRANAEGINVREIKAAMISLESKLREDALDEASKGWAGFQGVTTEHMVGVLTSTRYKGGYMYPGATVSPKNFQAVAWSRPGDSVDGDPEGAKLWLEAAEIGTVVEKFYDLGNGISQEVYQKTQQGWGYIRTKYESEERDAARRCYLHGNEAVVAAAMGVKNSPTFRAIYQAIADQLYYGL